MSNHHLREELFCRLMDEIHGKIRVRSNRTEILERAVKAAVDHPRVMHCKKERIMDEAIPVICGNFHNLCDNLMKLRV